MKILPVSFEYNHGQGWGNVNTKLPPISPHEYFLIPEYNITTKEITGYSFVHRTMVMPVEKIEEMERKAIEDTING